MLVRWRRTQGRDLRIPFAVPNARRPGVADRFDVVGTVAATLAGVLPRASLMRASWNQIIVRLRQIDGLHRAA